MATLLRLHSRLSLLAAVVLAVVAASPSAAARSRVQRRISVPQGFVGMNIGGPLDGSVDEVQQVDTMVRSGVETVRVLINWASAQPYQSWSQVPLAEAARFTDVGGIPTDFSPTDQIVGLAAEHRITVLPVVLFAPAWDTAPHQSGTWGIPASPRPYANFLSALIARYGPHGSFWQIRSPKVPIRMWQIWNEPSIVIYWPEQPFARSYVSLLRAAHAAIKRADPGAKVVLAGLPNYSWKDLPSIYGVRGARRLFDIVAIHPYTRRPRDVIAVLRRIRRIMDRAGDRHKPIIADEVSWPSSLSKTSHTDGYDIATTESGQAKNLSALLPMLGADRRKLGLLGFDWYTWTTTEQRGALPFDYSGLLRFASGRFVPKPAFFAFRRAALALEACRKKATLATICLRRAG